jgi:hypothetical protein
MMVKLKTINVQGISVATYKVETEVFVSFTDIAGDKGNEEAKNVVKRRICSKTTVEFPGLRGKAMNPACIVVKFDYFLCMVCSNWFSLTPWNGIAPTIAFEPDQFATTEQLAQKPYQQATETT